LEERARALELAVQRYQQLLERDPDVERLAGALEQARRSQEAVSLRLRAMEREVEGHRARMRARNAELMSGRIHNPTELLQMSAEVEHMKARLASEEDEELEVMAEAETAEAELARTTSAFEQARTRAAAEEPRLRQEMEAAHRELEDARRERDELWARVPPQYQREYRRIRVQPAIAEVVAGQCSACHVAVTSSQMQQLRRSDDVIECDNCGRILVMA
jgi:predicted  nucleic acid-binding Zn-ribbon protein